MKHALMVALLSTLLLEGCVTRRGINKYDYIPVISLEYYQGGYANVKVQEIQLVNGCNLIISRNGMKAFQHLSSEEASRINELLDKKEINELHSQFVEPCFECSFILITYSKEGISESVRLPVDSVNFKVCQRVVELNEQFLLIFNGNYHPMPPTSGQPLQCK